MKPEFEIIHPDEGSSFRLLNEKVAAENYRWQYHYHPEYEIVCVLQGNGTRHVGNHLQSYENGDVVFMGPNLPHAGFGLNSHGQHEEIVVQIKEEVFKQSIITRPEMTPIVSLLEKARYGIHFTGSAKDKITRKLTRLLKMPPFEKFMELVTVLHLMATTGEYELLNPAVTLSSTLMKNNVRLKAILSYVEQHFQEDIDIKKVAAVAHLSIPSFCNYFKKIMNITYTDFVNRYRIQHACILLQQEKTISQASFECGFNNVAYFNKVFKTVINKTPSEFKKKKSNAFTANN
ncbi:MAG: AraC family transcriptional regulator [Panacibacter sp.]